MKLTQEEYKKLKEDELISTNIWFLKEYLSELSPTKSPLRFKYIVFTDPVIFASSTK